MGCGMSCLRHSSEPKSAEQSAEPKSRCPKRSMPDKQTRRCKEKEHHKKSTLQMQKGLEMSWDYSLTLEDCLLHSPAGLKSPRKKIHPFSSGQVPRLSISEAKDSMCLDRPMMFNNNCKQEEEYLPVNVKEEEKKVRFKLPHVVILYSPEEEPHSYCKTSEDSFYVRLEENCGGGSFESPDELRFRLAVTTLPHASFSSGL